LEISEFSIGGTSVTSLLINVYSCPNENVGCRQLEAMRSTAHITDTLLVQKGVKGQSEDEAKFIRMKFKIYSLFKIEYFMNTLTI
jgi:hypothetical protein